MNITIISIGKTKRDAAAELAGEYQKRLAWKIQMVDLDPPKKSGDKAAEADLISSFIPKNSFLIALDERGKNPPSRDLADSFQNWQNAGHNHFCLIIGGADGLDSALVKRANYVLALGAMTWPHRLVKVMILEQLYRASSILSGHPYHRD